MEVLLMGWWDGPNGSYYGYISWAYVLTSAYKAHFGSLMNLYI